MNRIVKIGVSAVACAALIIVGNATAGHYMTHTNQTEQGEVTVEENPFVICAQAAELTRDNPVYIKEAVSDTFGFRYGDNEGKAGFIMEMPLSVKGDKIKSVTYSIKNGFFEVVDKEKGDSTIIDSSAYEGAPSSFVTVEETEEGKSVTIYAAGEATEEDREARANQKALSSYTVAYDKQISDNTVINICGDSVLTEKEMKALYGSTDPQETADMYNKMFGDTVITCTVTFADGTTQEQKIGIGGAVLTYEQMGQLADQPAESPEDTSQEQAFLKLQLK
ncbi:MAG: type-F conjugative transfer system secretin TraK [Lachnobacterium sp.]|nr:type-F conjugative transfer system secretin TraK [Lachnobacterium sp.]